MDKTYIEEMKEKLFYNPKHASEVISADETETAVISTCLSLIILTILSLKII